jgi:2-oxoglutarate ferredoxin oxidoreductase subunit gamma
LENGKKLRGRAVTEKVIMAGAGGQGMMALGKLLAKALAEEGKHVTFFPSYGTEVRGGTAHCHVVISDGEIYSPVIEDADTLIIMNQPSLDKFIARLKEKGLLLVNNSMAAYDGAERRVEVVEIPATELANKLGSALSANMIMLGAYNQLKNFLDFERLVEYISDSFSSKGKEVVTLNKRAIEKGAKFVEDRL